MSALLKPFLERWRLTALVASLGFLPMAFNVGGIIGGGLTPMIAQALSTQGGLVPVGIYLAVAALISLVALLPLKHQQA